MLPRIGRLSALFLVSRFRRDLVRLNLGNGDSQILTLTTTEHRQAALAARLGIPYQPRQISHLFDGLAFKLGDDVIAEMKKSKDLDYHFVSEDKASKGIKKGDYYMVITFPENFSENFQRK
jgi:hypothetical protein